MVAPHAKSTRTRFLGVIREECDRMATLLSDVSDLSRIEGGECTLRLSATTLRELGRSALDQLSDRAHERGVLLQLDADDSRVEVDVDLMRRGIENLIQNAIEFSPEGGTVRLSLTSRAEDWTCVVQDDGPPLARSGPRDVFEHFIGRRHRGRRHAAASPGGRAGPPPRGWARDHARHRRAARRAACGPSSRRARGAEFCFTAPLRQTASARARRVARQALGRPDCSRCSTRSSRWWASRSRARSSRSCSWIPTAATCSWPRAPATRGRLGGRRTAIRSGVAGAVAAWGHPILVEDIETDRRFRRLSHPQYNTKSLLCVPLRVEGEVIGVVNANNKQNGETVRRGRLGLLVMITERVGSAIERACAYPDSERVVDDALAAVQAMTQLKREFALGGRRTVKRARALARTHGAHARRDRRRGLRGEHPRPRDGALRAARDPFPSSRRAAAQGAAARIPM
jgi:GAF domain-containing protein